MIFFLIELGGASGSGRKATWVGRSGLDVITVSGDMRGGNYRGKGKEVRIGRDFRDTEYRCIPNSVTTNNQESMTDIHCQKLISNRDNRPEEEKLIGLNVEDKKRRSGPKDQSTMDTDGVLQCIGFTAENNTPMEAGLSNSVG